MKWKLIETVAGRIEVVTGPGTETRPDWHQHEWLVWEGDATNSSDALRKAAQAEPKLDIQHMRLRHELDLTKIDIRTGDPYQLGNSFGRFQPQREQFFDALPRCQDHVRTERTLNGRWNGR